MRTTSESKSKPNKRRATIPAVRIYAAAGLKADPRRLVNAIRTPPTRKQAREVAESVRYKSHTGIGRMVPCAVRGPVRRSLPPSRHPAMQHHQDPSAKIKE